MARSAGRQRIVTGLPPRSIQLGKTRRVPGATRPSPSISRERFQPSALSSRRSRPTTPTAAPGLAWVNDTSLPPPIPKSPKSGRVPADLSTRTSNDGPCEAGRQPIATRHATSASAMTISHVLMPPTRSVFDGFNERLHVGDVLLERLPAGRGEAVFRFRHPALEAFLDGDVARVFELARVHAEVAVGRFEQALQIVERQRVVDRQRADDGEAHALVDDAIEARGLRLGSRGPLGFRGSGLVARFAFVVSRF